MTACIFCKIVNGEVPSAKIFESDHVISFLDINPANEGHALVLPKGHFGNFMDIPDDILFEMDKGIKKIVKAMNHALGNEGYNILMNNGSVAGQVIFHAHYHIIPRFSGDGHSFHLKTSKYQEGKIEEMVEKLKKFL